MKYKYTRKQIATDIRLLTSNIEKLDENGIIKSLCLLEIDLVDTKPTKVKKIEKLDPWDYKGTLVETVNQLVTAVNKLTNPTN